MKKINEYFVMTCEHRRYVVKAKTYKKAKEIVENSDLSPKDERVSLESFGDFEIVE